MRHRRRRIIEGPWFNLNSVTNPKTGRKHYEISINAYKWHVPGAYEDVRRHFDPAGNRGKKFGTKWKYSNLREAERLITLALLKWGS